MSELGLSNLEVVRRRSDDLRIAVLAPELQREIALHGRLDGNHVLRRIAERLRVNQREWCVVRL
jgi:hypothetical protein